VKAFPVAKLAADQGGEFVLGMKDLHSDACYLIYGLLQAGETQREVRPGEGYEEILCAVDGPLVMHTNRGDITLEQGHAIHVREDEFFGISNPSTRQVVYVAAGGKYHHSG
jgi:hypothetical protein